MKRNLTRVLSLFAASAVLSTAVWAQQPAAPAATAASAAPAAPAAAAAAPAAAAPTRPAGNPGLAAPGWNVPPKWESVERTSAYASVKGRETDVLIQDGGHEWRKFRNGPLTVYGGWLIILAALGVVAYYFIKGAIQLKTELTGRMMVRFSEIERVTHWTMAISFVVLAISGLVMFFGKFVLIPVIGHKANAALTVFLKNVHNFIGPLFLFAVVIAFFLFLRDNVWKNHDWEWMKKAGGLFSGEHVSSHRFNAGEKLWFWLGVVGLGLAMGVSGLVMNFPNWNQGREVMQTMNIIHAVGSVLFIVMSFGHIYMGTLGVKGAYAAMRTGQVDEAWAQEHHDLWYQDMKNGRINTGEPAAKPQPAAGD